MIIIMSYCNFLSDVLFQGIDMSQEMLTIAQRKYEVEHPDQTSRRISASFSLMDAKSLDYTDQTVRRTTTSTATVTLIIFYLIITNSNKIYMIASSIQS